MARFERFFFALGRGAKAMKKSADARAPTEAPPAPEPAPEKAGQAITLVRCPKCGAYIPADHACSCTSG